MPGDSGCGALAACWRRGERGASLLPRPTAAAWPEGTQPAAQPLQPGQRGCP